MKSLATLVASGSMFFTFRVMLSALTSGPGLDERVYGYAWQALIFSVLMTVAFKLIFGTFRNRLFRTTEAPSS